MQILKENGFANVREIEGGFAAWIDLQYPVVLTGNAELPIPIQGTWSKPWPEMEYPINDLWGESPEAVFAVGDGGTIFYYDGTTWSKTESGITADLQAVWGTARTDVYAAGSSGTLIHYNGSEWEPLESGTSDNLRDIWSHSTDDVFIAGTQALYHIENGTLLVMDTGDSSNFSCIWGISGDNVYAVAHNEGPLLYYNGTVWSKVNLPVSYDHYEYNNIQGNSSKDIWVTGENILHYDGQNWILFYAEASGRNLKFSEIWVNNENDIYIAGELGNVLHYNGSFWETVYNNPDIAFTAIWGSLEIGLFAPGRESGKAVIIYYSK